jgi:ketosteroid isomerase-like protein
VSRDNIEIVRCYVDAWNRRDLDAVLAVLDPEFEVDLSRSRAPYQGIYRRRSEVLGRWKDLWDAWDDIHLDLESAGFIAAGDRVVAIVPARLRGRQSGIALTGMAAVVCTIRDAKIARHEMWQSRAEALEAVGLG